MPALSLHIESNAGHINSGQEKNCRKFECMNQQENDTKIMYKSQGLPMYIHSYNSFLAANECTTYVCRSGSYVCPYSATVMASSKRMSVTEFCSSAITSSRDLAGTCPSRLYKVETTCWTLTICGPIIPISFPSHVDWTACRYQCA